ncbi:MAG: Gfo/Idh/MocA family protein [Planctomycetota bacterium]
MKDCLPKTGESITRRGFLRRSAMGAATAFGFPYVVPCSVFGSNSPANRITMGCIGLGGMGTNDMRAFLGHPDVQVVAVCDVVRGSREYGHWYKNGWKGNFLGRVPGQKIVEEHYSGEKESGMFKGCGAYVDFRELLARADIDSVTIVTPDHWHALMSIMAAKAGKHIYCEKPMTLTIAEGRAMTEAVRRHGVVFQTGSHERSRRKTRFGCELVRNGRIGRLKRIIAPVGPNNRQPPAVPWKPMAIPEGFDYDMWLGPAKWEPYHKDRCLYKFRFILDYSGGQTTNLGAHSLDMAQWGNGTDDTGPIEVEDLGGEFPGDGLFDTPTKIHFRARYANGVELICKTDAKGWVGARFEGTEGWVQVGRFETFPESLKTSVIGPDEIHLYESSNHHRNFIDSIKTRRQTAAPVEVGHRSATLCHLGNIAMMLRRKLRWDPDAERFIGDDEANRMLDRPRRAPWNI